MKTKITILIFLFFSASTTSYSQNNKIFIGENVYTCTKKYGFINYTNYSMSDFCKPSISFAKNGNSGFFIFSIRGHKVKGTVYLYLDDNTVIKMYDKNFCDCVNEGGDNWCTCIYNLTSQEIIKLKTTNIQTIRYSLYKYIPGFDDNISVGNFSVENAGFFNNDKNEETPRHDFPGIFTNLFK